MAERYIPPRVLNVIAAVAFERGIGVDEILSRSRFPAVEEARVQAMRAVRMMSWVGSEPSYPLIGRWFDRHHTTVLSACKKIERPQQLSFLWKDQDTPLPGRDGGRNIAG